MKKKYSNYTIDTSGGLNSLAGNTGYNFGSGYSFGGSNSTGSSGLLSAGTTGKVNDWTAQNTVDVINTGSNLIQSVLTSIFGKNNQYLASSYNTLYEQEKKTNTILWVAIGLVLALGVFLVIRKTK